MNFKRIRMGVDLLFCCVFLPLTIALVPVERWIEKYTSFAILLILFLYGVYFAVRFINFPQLVMKRQYLKTTISVVVLLTAAYLLGQYPFPDGIEPVVASRPTLYKHLRAQTVWFMFLVVTGYGLSISLLLELFRQILSKKEIESAKNKAELSLYKAQINPHFIFNTLNTLYGLTISKSDQAEDAFVKFIEMMKYNYTHVNKDMIAIGNELKYIQDYISLQSIRLNHHTIVQCQCGIDDENVPIPPMLLITIVENAFKYGVSSTRDCVIDIKADLNDRHLVFQVTNQIMQQKSNNELSVGLNNCKARLDLLYSNRHKLDIVSDNGVFNVSLEIDL